MPRSSRKPSEATPARMGQLAKLPVFWNLEQKRVVIAGGTAAAAWKAELIAATGARVEIYATELESEMQALLVRGAADGELIHHCRPWALDIFDNAVLALADAETDDEARAYYCAAVAAGVPVNVIDKPAFCQFQFGSIVNRSPVIVGISTDGAAPILGQAVRRRIETLLPASLAAWGHLSKRVREFATQTLAPGAERRAFWEQLSDLAFSRSPSETETTDLEGLVRSIKFGGAVSQGRVTLVGAGPGDPDLLTLKAVRALQSADVILFDDLVSDGVLELARREAKRMMVGKRGGRESCSQDDINALMVKLAEQGKHVVRLKSGDPMIFGRAGEEIAMLERHGIPVAVVSGITAASAMAAHAKTSLTHRDFAQSVRFVTGHARNGLLPDDLDWRGLADGKCTLVFYMGGRTAPMIAARLISDGLSNRTPVMICSSISRPHQTIETTDLEALKTFGGGQVDGPILIAIGQALGSATESAVSAASQDWAQAIAIGAPSQ